MDKPEELAVQKVKHRRVHMANERTFLAWIRTSIAIMAFGFVVERFAIFIKQVSLILGRTAGHEPVAAPVPAHAYSTFFGIILVGLGAVMGVLAFVRFKRVERQIDENSYQPSRILDVLLVLSILAIGIFLVIYLIHSM